MVFVLLFVRYFIAFFPIRTGKYADISISLTDEQLKMKMVLIRDVELINVFVLNSRLSLASKYRKAGQNTSTILIQIKTKI